MSGYHIELDVRNARGKVISILVSSRLLSSLLISSSLPSISCFYISSKESAAFSDVVLNNNFIPLKNSQLGIQIDRCFRQDTGSKARWAHRSLRMGYPHRIG